MNSKYILAIDQGTTSSRAVVFDKKINKVITDSSFNDMSEEEQRYIEKIPKEKVASNYIEDIAKNDEDEYVRRKAVAKLATLTNQGKLCQYAQCSYSGNRGGYRFGRRSCLCCYV